MKKFVVVILAALAWALPSLAQQWVGIPPVPIVPQEQSEWCWAASSQFVLAAYGLSASQSAIVVRAHGNTSNLPGSDADITNTLNGWAQMPDGSKIFIHGTELSGMLSPQALYNSLSTGHPVLIAYISGPNTGHAVVVTAAVFVQTTNGLRVSSLAYRDPWPSPENLANAGRVELSGPALTQFVSKVRASWVTWLTR